jgi:phosphopantetheinyl transferase
MPLFSKENINEGTLALWEITESPEELLLLLNLTHKETEKYKKFSNIRRKKEWLATRILLKEVISEPSTICYQKDGKPYLQNNPYNIGISHSAEFAVLYIHKEKTPGIDIENRDRSIEKIAPKFMSEAELKSCLINKDEYSKNKLFIHWSAKEAVFKMIPHQGIEFSTQIIVSPFNMNNQGGKIDAVYRHKEKQEVIPLSYRFIKNNLLVWGVY